MKNPFGFGLAIAATASLAFAGGGGEGKEKAKTSESNSRKLEQMGSGQEEQTTSAMLDAGPGEGFTITVGDDFSLKILNWVQVLYRYTAFDDEDVGGVTVSLGDSTSNFSIPRARTEFGGHVWEETMTYYVQLDWVDGGTLLDAWFRWAFWQQDDNEVALRVGQQKAHFGREFQGIARHLEFIDYSLATRTFSNNRVLGAWLQGSHLEGDKLHWNIGVGNSDAAAGTIGQTTESGNGAANTDQRMNYFFDVRFDPMGDFGDEFYVQGDLDHHEDLKGTIGASLMLGNEQSTAAGMNVETTAWNFYTAWKYQGIHALAEAFLREDDLQGGTDSDSAGYAIGGSYTLPPQEEGGHQWAFGARVSQVRNEDNQNLLAMPFNGSTIIPGFGALGLAQGRVTEIEGVIDHYYHEHKMKAQLGYRFQRAQADAVPDAEFDNHSFELLFQWIF